MELLRGSPKFSGYQSLTEANHAQASHSSRGPATRESSNGVHLIGAFMRRTDFFLFAAMLGLLKWHRLLMASRRIAASIFVFETQR